MTKKKKNANPCKWLDDVKLDHVAFDQRVTFRGLVGWLKVYGLHAHIILIDGSEPYLSLIPLSKYGILKRSGQFVIPVTQLARLFEYIQKVLKDAGIELPDDNNEEVPDGT